MHEDINFITDNYIVKYYRTIEPELQCRARNESSYSSWQKALKKKVRELLGPDPAPAPLKPELLLREQTEKYIREKWVIQTEQDCFMPLYLLIPKDVQGKVPAILCCHGHGPYGKDSVAGVTMGQPERASNIADYNMNYAEQMTERGYVTLTPDWRSFGERIGYSGQDLCEAHFLQHLILGRTLLGANLFDAGRALDFLLTRKEVDKNKIGCMGMSFGGTMTTYLTLLDSRIKAADIICYSTTTEHYAVNHANNCGTQIVPYLYRYADVGDVIAAIAPKPLLLESKVNDTCFYLDSAKKAHKIVKKGYQAAGVPENLWIEYGPGIHGFTGGQVFPFFEKHLAGR